MSEVSKFDIFMDEISALEKQVYLLVQKSEDLIEVNKELEKEIEDLKNENEVLKLKFEELVVQTGSTSSGDPNLFGNEPINPEEKEILKNKISDLISKIDYHLRS